MLGKTIPELTSDGRVFVCSAGYSEDFHALVRLYPLERRATPCRGRNRRRLDSQLAHKSAMFPRRGMRRRLRRSRRAPRAASPWRCRSGNRRLPVRRASARRSPRWDRPCRTPTPSPADRRELPLLCASLGSPRGSFSLPKSSSRDKAGGVNNPTIKHSTQLSLKRSRSCPRHP
jgi:hypothetical protein